MKKENAENYYYCSQLVFVASQVSPKLLLLALFLKAFLYVQSSDTRYLVLDDGRKLCLECLDSAVMDTHECQPLYLEIQDFYEGLNMKVEQQIPLLLVERQALNEAMEGEKNVRFFCLLRWEKYEVHAMKLLQLNIYLMYINTQVLLNCNQKLLFTIFVIVCRVIITCLKQEDSAYQKNKSSALYATNSLTSHP